MDQYESIRCEAKLKTIVVTYLCTEKLLIYQPRCRDDA